MATSCPVAVTAEGGATSSNPDLGRNAERRFGICWRHGSVTACAFGASLVTALMRPVALCATFSVVAREITQRELRHDSGEIMRQLDDGESFIVTRNGVPVGELSPLRRHRFVRSDTAIALFRHAPPIDLGKLRGDLDRAASQDLDPRG